MAKLSTHILDTTAGKPAANVTIDLYVRSGNSGTLLKSLRTNSDGRTDELLLNADEIAVAEYELVFHIGDYFAQKGESAAMPNFLNQVPIRFTISDAAADYHVPLLATPWSYSTYRGS